MAELSKSLQISGAGMDAQTARLRVIAENMANQDSTGASPGADAYRRKTITFENRMNAAAGAPLIGVKKVGQDQTPLPLKYDPSNPAANADGYVKLPNVNVFIEMMDMREAERNYNANLSVMQATRNMLNRTLDLLKQ